MLDEAFHCVCSETFNCFEHTLDTCFQDKYPLYLKITSPQRHSKSPHLKQTPWPKVHSNQVLLRRK